MKLNAIFVLAGFALATPVFAQGINNTYEQNNFPNMNSVNVYGQMNNHVNGFYNHQNMNIHQDVHNIHKIHTPINKNNHVNYYHNPVNPHTVHHNKHGAKHKAKHDLFNFNF